MSDISSRSIGKLSDKAKAEQIKLGLITAALRDNDDLVHGTFIVFDRKRQCEKGVTQIWFVHSSGTTDLLGSVKWFGRWRKYGFYPVGETVYEETCMREIAHFCETLTRLHREKKSQEFARKLIPVLEPGPTS